jgi:hypothetical protein
MAKSFENETKSGVTFYSCNNNEFPWSATYLYIEQCSRSGCSISKRCPTIVALHFVPKYSIGPGDSLMQIQLNKPTAMYNLSTITIQKQYEPGIESNVVDIISVPNDFGASYNMIISFRGPTSELICVETEIFVNQNLCAQQTLVR